MSDRLGEIIRGEVVLVRALLDKRIVGRIEVCHDPQPLRDTSPVRMVVGVTRNGVKLNVSPRLGQAPVRTIPSFGEIWDRINARTP